MAHGNVSKHSRPSNLGTQLYESGYSHKCCLHCSSPPTSYEGLLNVQQVKSGRHIQFSAVLDLIKPHVWKKQHRKTFGICHQSSHPDRKHRSFHRGKCAGGGPRWHGPRVRCWPWPGFKHDRFGLLVWVPRMLRLRPSPHPSVSVWSHRLFTMSSQTSVLSNMPRAIGQHPQFGHGKSRIYCHVSL